MKYSRAILICVGSIVLGGCGWLSAPWAEGPEDPSVPVSSPVEQEEFVQRRPEQPVREPTEEPDRPDPERPAPTDEPEEPVTEPPDEPQVRERPEPEIVGEPEVVGSSTIQVNGRLISVDDVLRGAHRPLTEAASAPEPAFRHRAAEIILDETRFQIGQALLATEARRRMTEDQERIVDAEMERIRRAMIASAGGSRTELQNRLREEGLTFQEFLDAQREQLMVQLYLRSRFTPEVSVTRRELWDYYQENIDEFSTPKRVQMQIIAAPADAYVPDEPNGAPTSLELSAARDKARQRIEEAAEQLRQGRDFAEVVNEYSEGVRADRDGIWPLMPEGSFRLEEVEQAAFELAQGEVSDIIETDDGFYIVRAHRVEPGDVVQFQQAQEEIRETLMQSRYERLTQEYMDNLLGEATIAHSEDFIETAVDEAVDRFGVGG